VEGRDKERKVICCRCGSATNEIVAGEFTPAGQPERLVCIECGPAAYRQPILAEADVVRLPVTDEERAEGLMWPYEDFPDN
jgi:hypothetical protein